MLLICSSLILFFVKLNKYNLPKNTITDKGAFQIFYSDFKFGKAPRKLLTTLICKHRLTGYNFHMSVAVLF